MQTLVFDKENEIVGLKGSNQNTQDDLFSMIKLCILFYVDDTVLMTESGTDLQKSLDVFSQWKLYVNIAKTKILVFSKGRMTQR